MNKIWGRETLRFVGAWACKGGTPEDDEDRKNGIPTSQEEKEKVKSSGVLGEDLV